MKILLVSNYLPDAQQSMLRFSAMLARELAKAGHEVRVLRPEVRLGRVKPPAARLAKWLGYADKFMLFTRRLREAARIADVVHICDHAYSLYTRHLGGIPNVVTCHDLLAVRCALNEFPGHRPGWSGRQYQGMIVDGLRRALFVGCDSEATRADVLRLAGIPEAAAQLIHVGFAFPYRPAPEAERKRRLERLGIGPNEHYLIHVGTDVWYKNLVGLVRIFHRLILTPQARDLRLVLVGSRLSSGVKALVRECGMSDRVKMLSNVDDADLQTLYSAAAGLLFPSLAEGFGWPVVEAQACGCPAFVSNRQPMTEMGGDAAVYFDPEDYEAAAQIIRRNLPRYPELRRAGLANSRRFSAGKMASAYVELYGRAVAGTHKRSPKVHTDIAS